MLSRMAPWLCWCPWVWATILPLPDAGYSVIGKDYRVFFEPGDTLDSLAREHRVGIDELKQANLHLQHQPSLLWQRIVIPQRFVLPHAPREGIVINLPEKRLYYYLPETNRVITFPVAIGRRGWRTPLLSNVITKKEAQPSWRVPASIKRHYAATKGILLPNVVPPGPDNPLGDYAMRIGHTSILIHGTNRPMTVGQRSSSGCMRMRPEDINTLFPLVEPGIKVNIVNQPHKIGFDQHHWYLESHPELPDQSVSEAHTLEMLLLQHELGAQTKQIEHIDWLDTGIPQIIHPRTKPEEAI